MKRAWTYRPRILARILPRVLPRVLLLCAAFAATPLVLGLTAASAHAQAAVKLSPQQLDALTAPVALYPDALLAQVLMAATFPQDVEAAAAWSKSNSSLQGDAAVKAVAAEPWDPSVQSLVAFPQVLATMAAKPDWVAQLGDAFLAQPDDVMDSAQRLRKQAQQAGNLKSNSQQKVIVEQSTIQIVPANPQVVYVPTYNPTVVYGTWPYPAYPPVYVPPPPGYAIASGLVAGLAFGAGVAVADSLWGGFDWDHHDVNVNVNRYNNVNVNNRLDVNGGTTNWNRNANINRNNANINRGDANLNRGGATLGNTDRAQRDAYRARDDTRAQARQTLQTRTGQDLTGSASQRVQDIHAGGAGGTRSPAGNRTATGDAPGNRAGAGTAAGNRASTGAATGNRTSAAAGNRAGTGGTASNSDLRNRAQNANRDSALRGAGDGNAARQDTQRGQASRAALANRNTPAAGAGPGARGARQPRTGPSGHGGGRGAGQFR